MKEKIIKLLYQQLGSIYCDSCDNVDTDAICDYCHRKSMSWSLSWAGAEGLADAIMKIVSEE